MKQSASPFFINGRFLGHRATGVQRYAIEISKRFVSGAPTLKPTKSCIGIKGHMWEQIFLATASSSKLLWSPCNTGPIFRKRQVVTIHDIIPIDHPEWFTRRFAAVYSQIIPRVIRSSEHVIAVSKYTKERIVRRFQTDPAKVTAIPNGVGEEFYRRAHSEVSEMRRYLGIPNIPYFLTISSIDPRKNLSTLLAAWRSMRDRKGDSILVIAGNSTPAIFARVSISPESRDIKYLGYVPDELLPALYSGATGFVYPSLYEGFGLPVLEATSCGVPTVTSNSTSLPEICGPNTTLVDPQSESEIAAAMVRILDRTGQQAECSAGVEHSRTFSWLTTAKKTESLLLSVS